MGATISDITIRPVCSNGAPDALRAAMSAQNAEEYAVAPRGATARMSIRALPEPKLASAARDDCLRQLDLEYENLRAALTWFVERRAPTEACRLVGALCLFWVFDERVSEGRRWVQRCLEMPTAHEVATARAKALQTAGHLAWVQGDHRSARRTQ